MHMFLLLRLYLSSTVLYEVRSNISTAPLKLRSLYPLNLSFPKLIPGIDGLVLA